MFKISQLAAYELGCFEKIRRNKKIIVAKNKKLKIGRKKRMYYN